MSALSQPAKMSWFQRAEAWLDERGKGAWIAAAVFGLILFWPIGLALFAYMIWSKRMFKTGHKSLCKSHKRHRFASSGNTAFDSYKADMLQRLEDEQVAFESFLRRLRDAKDKSEFDAFMEERTKLANQPE